MILRFWMSDSCIIIIKKFDNDHDSAWMTMLRFVSRRYPPVPPAGAGGAALSLLIVYTTITTNNFVIIISQVLLIIYISNTNDNFINISYFYDRHHRPRHHLMPLAPSPAGVGGAALSLLKNR